MTKKKLSPKFWLALTIFSLIGQIAWVVENMYFNVFIYKMFHASPSDISLMVSASAIAATVTTVLIGALSDKIGKRKLFICGGYILWGISIWSFALIRIEIIEAIFPMAVSAASQVLSPRKESVSSRSKYRLRGPSASILPPLAAKERTVGGWVKRTVSRPMRLLLICTAAFHTEFCP